MASRAAKSIVSGTQLTSDPRRATVPPVPELERTSVVQRRNDGGSSLLRKSTWVSSGFRYCQYRDPGARTAAPPYARAPSGAPSCRRRTATPASALASPRGRDGRPAELPKDLAALVEFVGIDLAAGESLLEDLKRS